MVKKHLFIIVALIACCDIAIHAEELDKDVKRGFESIRPMDCYAYCKMLSSQEFAGRLTGHEGYTAAAEWVAKKFKIYLEMR